jgi:hypothetical protein
MNTFYCLELDHWNVCHQLLPEEKHFDIILGRWLFHVLRRD